MEQPKGFATENTEGQTMGIEVARYVRDCTVGAMDVVKGLVEATQLLARQLRRAEQRIAWLESMMQQQPQSGRLH